MREYDAKTLRKLQLTELSIYKDFDALCRKNNIPFFALCGTAIGALRHGGFIPWDDDIDVAFMRNDYENFMSIAIDAFKDKYEFVTAKRFENYPLMTTRMCLKGTRFKEVALEEVDCPLGIFLDIYAYDCVAKDEKKRKSQLAHAWFWSKLGVLRDVGTPVLPLDGFAKTVAAALCRLIHLGLKAVRFPKKKIVERYDYWVTLYNNEDTGIYTDFTDTRPEKYIMTRDEIFPIKFIPFEDTQLPVPNKIEAWLTRFYGDYMQLPPVGKRKNHYPAELDFGAENE
jgi:LPS biosynthesis protein